MISSKKQIIKLTSLAIALTVLTYIITGCTPDKNEMTPVLGDQGNGRYSRTGNLTHLNNGALIEMGDVVLQDVKFNIKGSNKYSVPDSVQLQMEVCNIRDRAGRGADLTGLTFNIESELGSKYPVNVTTSRRCLFWTHDVPFNYFAPSVNVVVHYQFSPSAGDMGMVVRRISFNPWDMYRNGSKTKGFVDITGRDKDDWPQGDIYAYEAKDVLSALRGEFIKDQGQLFAGNVFLQVTEKESQKAEDYKKELEAMTPTQRKLRQEIDKILSSKTGMHMSVNMQLEPKIRLRDSTGMVHDIDLKEGQFKVFMQLMATGADNNGEKYILHQYLPHQDFIWTANENGLNVSLPLLLRTQTTYGRLALAIKVIPVGLNTDVKPLSAVYDLGLYNNWVRAQSPVLKRQGFKVLDNVDYDQYVKSAENFDKFLGGFKDGDLGIGDVTSLRPAEMFFFERFNIRFRRILPGETATDRTLQYSVRSCLVNGIYGIRAGNGLQFEVETEDQGQKVKIRRETDEEGCLDWFGLLSHKYYHKEVLFLKQAKVRFVGTRKCEIPEGKTYQEACEGKTKSELGKMINHFDKTFDYYINPWDEKFTFGWDARHLPDKFVEEVEAAKKAATPSRLIIADFKYETLGFRYEIDKYMNLKVKKTVLFKSYPHVLKYNSAVKGRGATEKLRDGVYLMKVALQKDYLDPASKGVDIKAYEGGKDPYARVKDDGSKRKIDRKRGDTKEFISAQTKLIRVLNGMIVTPMEFEMSDLRLMRIRNQFFIQLQTIDENKLRLASLLDRKLSEILFPNGDAKQATEKMLEIMDSLESMEKIDDQMDEFHRLQILKGAFDTLSEEDEEKRINLEQAKKEAEEKLKDLLGLVDVPGVDNPTDKQKRERLREMLAELDRYRKLDTNQQINLRNARMRVINRILGKLHDRTIKAFEEAETNQEEYDEKNSKVNQKDPFQTFFYISIENEEKALHDLLKGDYEALKELKNADFTTSPLRPNFSLDLLRNDGEAETEDTQWQSGLPSRTFVGPLTFLLNSNGSSLRPTDILNEKYCRSATCELPQLLANGQSPVPVPRVLGLDKSGEVVNDPIPVYDHGDSVNAIYENNKYYGYLKAYYGVTVDDLIKKAHELKSKYIREMESDSQIINYVRTIGLKYVLLNNNFDSQLKEVNKDCVNDKTTRVNELEKCFTPTVENNFQKDAFMERINLESSRLDPTKSTLLNHNHTHYTRKARSNGMSFNAEGDDARVTKADLMKFMTYGWKSDKIPKNKKMLMFHRMCFVLAQNLFKDSYLEQNDLEGKSMWGRFRENSNEYLNDFALLTIERNCHKYTQNLFDPDEKGELDKHVNTSMYPPVVFERKLRVYNTTKRYVYRGGKSMNINVSANFNLSAQQTYNTSTQVSWRPLEWVEGILGTVQRVTTGVLNAIIGGLGFTVNYTDSDAVSDSNGTTVYEGTFLVSQMATFDIEIGEYERCMTVRLSPILLHHFMIDMEGKLKEGFSPETAFDSQGLFICSGIREKKRLPVKEKYYYMTQHFTEGDMLDTADLHNHPWLLQLRGYRDFQTFVSMIKAREHKYTKGNHLQTVYKGVKTDLQAMGRRTNDNLRSDMVIVEEDNVTWPLDKLGEVYFNTTPTFPGIYTFVEKKSELANENDWPYSDLDPSQAFGENDEEYAD